MKASAIIENIRAMPGGEGVPNIYQAHMAALKTERALIHARAVVAELFTELEGSVEGPFLDETREAEINGLLLLWQKEEKQ